MAMVEEYYEMNEMEVVPVCWKVVQIVFYLCAGSLGLWCSYTMALIRIRLDDKCYLFTKVKNEYEKDIMKNVDWEGDFWCDYCQFSMVCSFIVSTIWATFFLMCGKGGKSLTGLPQPWRIVFGSFIFNIIYFSVSLSASIKIQQGTAYFCQQKSLKKEILKTYLNHCGSLNILFYNNPKLIDTTSLQLEIVVKTSWSCTFVWLILILIPFFRIVFAIDFRLYKIAVFKIDETVHNKREEVLKITNYEEPKKLYPDPINEVSHSREKSPEDLEKRKMKSENKSIHFRPARVTLKQNAAFYATADIRMLDGEKKDKIKVLKEMFERKRMQTGKDNWASGGMEELGASRNSLFYSNALYDQKWQKNFNDNDENSEGERAEPQADSSGSDDSVVENRTAIFKKQV